MTDEEKEAAAKEKQIDDAAKVKAADMLERYKEASVLAAELADARNENFKLRSDKRDLDRDLKDLKSKLPAEDAVVLTADQAANYNALIELGTPDEIKAQLETGKAAIEKNATAEKRTALDAAVKLAGYDPAAVALLSGALDLPFVVEKETKDGKAVEVPYIQDGDAKKPAGEVLAEKYGQSVIDRMKLEQSAGGTLINPALGGNPADAKATEATKQAGQAALYGGASF